MPAWYHFGHKEFLVSNEKEPSLRYRSFKKYSLRYIDVLLS